MAMPAARVSRMLKKRCFFMDNKFGEGEFYPLVHGIENKEPQAVNFNKSITVKKTNPAILITRMRGIVLMVCSVLETCFNCRRYQIRILAWPQPAFF